MGAPGESTRDLLYRWWTVIWAPVRRRRDTSSASLQSRACHLFPFLRDCPVLSRPCRHPKQGAKQVEQCQVQAPVGKGLLSRVLYEYSMTARVQLVLHNEGTCSRQWGGPLPVRPAVAQQWVCEHRILTEDIPHPRQAGRVPSYPGRTLSRCRRLLSPLGFTLCSWRCALGTGRAPSRGRGRGVDLREERGEVLQQRPQHALGVPHPHAVCLNSTSRARAPERAQRWRAPQTQHPPARVAWSLQKTVLAPLVSEPACVRHWRAGVMNRARGCSSRLHSIATTHATPHCDSLVVQGAWMEPCSC